MDKEKWLGGSGAALLTLLLSFPTSDSLPNECFADQCWFFGQPTGLIFLAYLLFAVFVFSGGRILLDYVINQLRAKRTDMLDVDVISEEGDTGFVHLVMQHLVYPTDTISAQVKAIQGGIEVHPASGIRRLWTRPKMKTPTPGWRLPRRTTGEARRRESISVERRVEERMNIAEACDNGWRLFSTWRPDGWLIRSRWPGEKIVLTILVWTNHSGAAEITVVLKPAGNFDRTIVRYLSRDDHARS